VKSLFLLRHATPSSSLPGQTDFERRLEPEGFAEAAAMGRRIAIGATDSPTAVLCSSARRTLETLDALKSNLPVDAEISSDRELYCAPRDALLQCVHEIDDAHTSALVIAHNPGIAVLANSLAGRGDADASERMSRRFPPGSLVVLRFDVDRWCDVRDKFGELLDFATPQDV
jgi:phosphohistidine phosphatase